MANYIKSKVQQSVSFLPILVVAFSAFSGVLFLNPSPSYAFDQTTLSRALTGEKNLFKADLSKANLSKADLRKVDLGEANLRKADLRKADLSFANLRGADLREADLSEATLSEAIADSKTKFPDGFDATGAGVIFRN
jgi:uncharacterized protein YjbI with pentapeptide repeats